MGVRVCGVFFFTAVEQQKNIGVIAVPATLVVGIGSIAEQKLFFVSDCSRAIF